MKENFEMNDELMFFEDSSLWVRVQKSEYLINLENINLQKASRKFVYFIPQFLLFILFNSSVSYAAESFPFKVYKNNKELTHFFNTLPNSNVTNVDSSTKNFSLTILILGLMNNLQNYHQNKVIQKSFELIQLKEIENKKIIQTLLISGGKAVLAISISFYAFSIILLIRFANSPEFKEKLKDFRTKQLFLFIGQITLLAISILFNDIKSFPIVLKKIKWKEKISIIFENYFEMLIFSALFIGIILLFSEYVFLPAAFKINPSLESMLDKYNLRLSNFEIDENLKKLQKRIKALQTISIKDKALIKVASTAEILERTYDRKLYAGMKNEMLRLMNELPLKPRNESFKPSYFYKMHQSYRIKQNLLALTYFLIYMNVFNQLDLAKIFNNLTNSSSDENDDIEYL